MTAAVGSAEDRPWWGQCVRCLGVSRADHARGLLKETRDRQVVANPDGLLTKMFKDMAAELGVGLRCVGQDGTCNYLVGSGRDDQDRPAGSRYHAVSEEGVPVRQIVEAVGRDLKVSVVTLPPSRLPEKPFARGPERRRADPENGNRSPAESESVGQGGEFLGSKLG